MALSNFPRFNDLPYELQAQIWTYAACPEGDLHFVESLLYDRLLDARMRCEAGPNDSIGWLIGLIATEYIPHEMEPEQQSAARAARLARCQISPVCRFAREMVLDVYKKEVQQIYVKIITYAEDPLWSLTLCEPHCQEEMVARFRKCINTRKEAPSAAETTG